MRAARGHPLSKAQAAANRAKSRIRARIERRIRRIYGWIFAVLLACYLAKIFVHPTPLSLLDELWARAAIGPIPGEVALGVGLLFHGTWIAVALLTLRFAESARAATQADRTGLAARGCRLTSTGWAMAAAIGAVRQAGACNVCGNGHEIDAARFAQASHPRGRPLLCVPMSPRPAGRGSAVRRNRPPSASPTTTCTSCASLPNTASCVRPTSPRWSAVRSTAPTIAFCSSRTRLSSQFPLLTGKRTGNFCRIGPCEED